MKKNNETGGGGNSPAHEPPASVALEVQHRLADPLHGLVLATPAVERERGATPLPVLEQEGYPGGVEAWGMRGRRGGGGGGSL